MFSKKDTSRSKVRIALVLVLVLALGAGAAWYWQQWMANKLVQASIATLKQDRPDIDIQYQAVHVNSFTKSVAFDDLTILRQGQTYFRVKNLTVDHVRLEDDTILHANVDLKNFGLQSGNRSVTGDMRFEYVADETRTNYSLNDFFFEDLASKSTVKWQSATVSNITRTGEAITHYDFAMQNLQLHVNDSGEKYDPAPMAVKFAFDKATDGLNHVRQFTITENSGKFLFGIDHIASQLADKNFAFLVEKIKIPAEHNPLAMFGYGEFLLNYAVSGTASPTDYQLRQEIALQDGFRFRILVSLDPSILDFDKLDANTNYIEKIRQLIVEYSDMSLLQRIYTRFGAENMKISNQQMVMSIAAAYGLDKDPNFAQSLIALQNFAANPGNIRMIIQPQPGLDLSGAMGLGMTNPGELTRQLRLQFAPF